MPSSTHKTAARCRWSHVIVLGTFFPLLTYCARRVAGAAGYVIQFDRRTGINRVDLDLFTLPSNTHLPSASLAFQLCPCALSRFNPLLSLPRLIFIPIYFLFSFPPAVRLSTSCSSLLLVYRCVSLSLSLSLLWCTNYLRSPSTSVDKGRCQAPAQHRCSGNK